MADSKSGEFTSKIKMIRRKTEAGLIPWIERARASLVASFANGVVKDEAAVRAAITSPWSNGQTEGQITRLKLVRRQMYGRGKIDLLQAGLIGAEQSELPRLRQSQICKPI
jgi:transposase